MQGKMEEQKKSGPVRGRVKWFDPTKGFGFVVPDSGGSDILLHANVLRNFGQSSVADNAGILITIQETDRGVQALEVHEIEPPTDNLDSSSEGISSTLPDFDDADVPLEPARVKWFDKAKGFGFVNVFGRDEDVFVHVEVLRKSGFADLQPGEAICLKVVDGSRGRMASMVASWDSVSKG